MTQLALTSMMEKSGPKHFNFWYETIIDLMIANPELKQHEIALRTGRTPAWISMVVNSDSFKARYAVRRQEHSERISRHVEDRLHVVAAKTLDRLAEVLDKKDLTPAFTLDATTAVLDRLGYAGKGKQAAQQPQNPPSNVQITVIGPVSQATLASAQGQIRALEQIRAAEKQPLMPRIDPDAEELKEIVDDSALRERSPRGE